MEVLDGLYENKLGKKGSQRLPRVRSAAEPWAPLQTLAKQPPRDANPELQFGLCCFQCDSSWTGSHGSGFRLITGRDCILFCLNPSLQTWREPEPKGLLIGFPKQKSHLPRDKTCTPLSSTSGSSHFFFSNSHLWPSGYAYYVFLYNPQRVFV